MFYRPSDGHGLPHNPFNAIVTPRPIAWVSTRDKDGRDNLAPYSFFNAVAYEPPQVMFASTSAKDDRDGTKDSVSNIRATGVFCVNIVSYALRGEMNKTSAMFTAGEDEFTHSKVTKAECATISCPRVLEAPASLECKLTHIQQLPGDANFVVFGEVTGVHISDDVIVDGKFDVTRYMPLARLGYRDYATINETFILERPGE